MARPLIALLTDFGLRDHYAATMKAVALGICPDVNFVDISHDIPPHDVLTGALELAACFRYFPDGTIFLAVVDPGVGGARRGIAVDAGGYRFVAPDNGLLSDVLSAVVPKQMVELTDRRYARPTISRTFEGRDRFAPAAAWLARGIKLTALGRPIASVTRLVMPAAQIVDRTIVGEVVRVDRFGNLITNIDRTMLERLGSGLTVDLGQHVIDRIVGTYAESAAGTPCALIGSSEHLEIAINGGSAAAALDLDRGASVRVRRGA
jgi:S-adenosylmethionine hydrolase